MRRSQLGLILIVAGFLQFVFSLILLVMISSLYIISLFIMFLSVIEVAVGFAYAKGVDSSLDIPNDECYYCKGTGMVNNDTCPRCGGTGLARSDD